MSDLELAQEWRRGDRDMGYKTPEQKAAQTRKWTADNPEKALGMTLRSRRETGYNTRKTRRRKEQHPEKVAAWHAVTAALRNGTLVRPSRCDKCGKECKPQAHHPDYYKPLEVVWWCRGCHLANDGKQIRNPRPGD